jgi:hypothetical protein
VRSGADIHLADAFEAPGCPLCRERRRTEQNHLESILSESVNDIGFRQGLDAARGFCGPHARAMLDADRARAGSLGASILLRATLVARLRDVEVAAGAKGWTRTRRMADALRPPACPVCDRVATADGHSVETVVRLAEDGAWGEAVASAPFCLDHLLALMDRRPVPAWWPPIEGRQVDRLRALRDRLERFAHASAHDRRHLQTDEQRASVDEAADLLAGPLPDAPPGRPPATGPVATGPAAPAADGRDAGGAAAVPAVPARDAAAVLLTGVYGSGKSTLAIELVDMLDAAGVAVAGVDLDWLGWYGAPVAWDEHVDPRLTIAHLEAIAASYLGVGVRRLVLAGTVPPAAVDRVEAAVGVPLRVVRLEVSETVVRRRLEGDPNGSRADDLERAIASLGSGPPDGRSDVVVDADRPVAELAAEVLARLGWLPG